MITGIFAEAQIIEHLTSGEKIIVRYDPLTLLFTCHWGWEYQDIRQELKHIITLLISAGARIPRLSKCNTTFFHMNSLLRNLRLKSAIPIQEQALQQRTRFTEHLHSALQHLLITEKSVSITQKIVLLITSLAGEHESQTLQHTLQLRLLTEEQISSTRAMAVLIMSFLIGDSKRDLTTALAKTLQAIPNCSLPTDISQLIAEYLIEDDDDRLQSWQQAAAERRLSVNSRTLS